MIEELEHARARGAHIYAEVLGYSINNDAFHMTTPLPSGESSIRAMREALADAELRARADRLHQRTRQFDSTQRQRGNGVDQTSVRRSCSAHSRKRDQGLLRASARRDRRHRSGALCACVGSGNGFRRRSIIKTPIQHAISMSCRITDGRPS